MPHASYQITGGLTPADIQKIHDQALGLIERVGLHVPHQPTLRLLSDFPGVRVQGERVCFRPELVQAALAAQRYPSHAEMTDRPFSIISGVYEINIIDMETGAVRQATYRDLVDMTKLAHSLGMHGSAPVKPMDLPPLLQELAHYKVSWEYSDRRPGAIFDANPISSVQAADYIYEMAQAAAKPFAMGLWIISPFRVTDREPRTALPLPRAQRAVLGGDDAGCRHHGADLHARRVSAERGRAVGRPDADPSHGRWRADL